MVQQLTYTRAIEVIASNLCNIPNPALLIVSDVTTNGVLNKIVCSNVDFIQLGVQIGDIVYVYADNVGATVSNILDANTLELNTPGIAINSGSGFFVYAGEQNDASKSGCVLFGLNASDLSDVTTLGGDLIPSIGLLSGQLLPIQVKSVSLQTNPILALW